jgi:DNA-binding transcriptional ArsR family regulator
MLSILFNSPLREKILYYLVETGEAYGTELSENFKASLFAVQNQLQRLEEAGILVSRSIGKTRMYTLNPRYFLLKELTALLKRSFAELPEEEVRTFYRPRKRPRRQGKPL